MLLTYIFSIIIVKLIWRLCDVLRRNAMEHFKWWRQKTWKNCFWNAIVMIGLLQIVVAGRCCRNWKGSNVWWMYDHARTHAHSHPSVRSSHESLCRPKSQWADTPIRIRSCLFVLNYNTIIHVQYVVPNYLALKDLCDTQHDEYYNPVHKIILIIKCIDVTLFSHKTLRCTL